MKKILGGLLFLAELILWIGAGRLAQLLIPLDEPLDAIFGLGVTVIFIIMWAIFLSPFSKRRLENLQRVLIVVIAAILIGFWLIQQGDVILGYLVMIGSSVIELMVQLGFKDYIYPDKFF